MRGPVQEAGMGLTTHWSQIEQLRGDAAAETWRWFIDRYREFVTVALRRLIWTPARAADASEEFWGYLFQSGAVERMQQPMHFRGFLMSTVRNYALHWMRRNPRPASAAVDGRVDEASRCLLEDEEVALWARQVLHLALQRLDREQSRWGWMLRVFYGLPATVDGETRPPQRASDIAAELGCTANALHQLLFRARQRLRECVVEEVRQTVSTRQDLTAELALLLTALGRSSPGIVAARPMGPEEP